MRIPFDLLAALLALESVRGLLSELYGQWFGPSSTIAKARDLDQLQSTTAQAFVALLGFWLIVWLMHELLARRAEWNTRWGLWPQGLRIVSTPQGLIYEPAHRHPLDVYARRATIAQFLSVGVYAAFIYSYGWPIKTTAWPYWLGFDSLFSEETCNVLSESLFINGLLDLGPFAVAMVLALIPKYRLLAMETGRREGVRRWLSFEMRLTFPPLILWLMLYGFWDLVALLVPQSALKMAAAQPWLMVIAGGVVLAGFAMALMPWMMVRLWHARPMADSVAKERLCGLLRRSGVKARAILEWGPPGTGFANACVLGPWAPFRYILISPGLMRLLSPEECEAVIAHEVGHVRHGHLGLLVIVVLGLAAWSDLILRGLDHLKYGDPITQGLVLMLLIVVYLRLLFGMISRRCERQADLAAAELVGSPVPLISALEKLAMLSGGIREVYSWHHDSIARRVTRLQTEGTDLEAIRRYHKSLRPMRVGLIGLSVIAIGLMLGWAVADGPPSGGKPAEETGSTSVLKEEREPGLTDKSGLSGPADPPAPTEGGPNP
jgi:Zn-dependent protease with chaperone function